MSANRRGKGGRLSGALFDLDLEPCEMRDASRDELVADLPRPVLRELLGRAVGDRKDGAVPLREDLARLAEDIHRDLLAAVVHDDLGAAGRQEHAMIDRVDEPAHDLLQNAEVDDEE